MSFVTGTCSELLYASATAATQVVFSSLATETQLNLASGTMGVQAHLPPDFWLPNNTSVGRGIKIVARGIFQVVAATTPTLAFTVRLGAAGTNITTPSAGPIVLQSAATATTSGTTTGYFRIEGDVILKAIAGTGGNSTATAVGEIITNGFGTTVGVATIVPMYGAGATPGTIATVDTSITNYINVDAAFGATGATNQITLQQLLVYGLN
jgi:hypothetical protein